MKKLLIIFVYLLLGAITGNAQIINTIAGNGTLGFSGDGGSATSAEFYYPLQIAFDALGNIYVSDNNNNVIRKIEISNGIISTVAGNGYGAGSSGGYSGDGGQATDAELFWPAGLALDLYGNIYIADYYNNRIREVNVSTGIIITIAGTGSQGYSGDGGQAINAELYEPFAIAFDVSGNMYISDEGNNSIRKLTMFTGIISTIAGNGIQGYFGDGGSATSAELGFPAGITLDDSGNVFIADCFNSRIRKVDGVTGIISTIAGNGYKTYSGDGGQASAAELYDPVDVKLDNIGNIYIADRSNNRIREIGAFSGIINTVAGIGLGGYYGDGGQATAAELDSPGGMEFDASGNLYFADELNDVVREISLATGIEQLKSYGNVLVYPNPSSGIFTLSLSNVNEKCNIEVYNVVGEKVLTEILRSTKDDNLINLTEQPNGVYFYRVISDTGLEIGSGKIIIQK